MSIPEDFVLICRQGLMVPEMAWEAGMGIAYRAGRDAGLEEAALMIDREASESPGIMLRKEIERLVYQPPEIVSCLRLDDDASERPKVKDQKRERQSQHWTPPWWKRVLLNVFDRLYWWAMRRGK